ncbi:MAG: family 10 glycosylhydrolase [Myxococcota bacterium]|jgi:hypothetical protein|nr:family 10 glycosylhydrolase [Myxococcota bacterium]
MHFASFDFGDPIFDAFGLRLSAQLFTLENLYGLDPAHARVETSQGRVRVVARGLRSAGGQRAAAGSFELVVEQAEPELLRLRATATAGAPIRGVKLLLRDLEAPLEASADGATFAAVGAHGDVFGYPTRIPTPLVWTRSGGATWALRAEDDRVREKRFALSTERIGALAGRGCIELIHDESAPCFSTSIATPDFVVDRRGAADVAEAEHVAWLARAFGLVPFEARSDLPAWACDLRLVAVLHGMHWSGRVFLDYAAMLDVLRFVTDRIDARHVLAYLPGWEGRYYWEYGAYRPDPHLGGERGFAALCDGARTLGVHLMPMFGANCVNATLPRFAGLDASMYLKSATGNRFHGNTPDWDLSRAHDTGWQAWLNPGHPAWRDDLAGQIETLAARFGFDAVFLDTSEVWINDRDHDVFAGYRALADRLHARIPGLLLAGEYDYDALIGCFPLFQRAWWTRAPAWSQRFVRRFAHLCEGEPEGRTGVHEFGIWKPGCIAAQPGLLATLAFQDETLARSRESIERAIAAVVEGQP